ncbi:MAG: hypothetical protein M1829_005906 [Trizodia sp. TS-e1964]|nr:MAG: hypothetical protein M1829_005906 [Trizodia sp. TS-e1964]
MTDQLVAKVQDVFEGQIDFEGQRLAELMTTLLLSVVGAVAFVVGFILQDIYLSLWIGLGGTALAFLLIVPPWPFFNQNPIDWLPGEKNTAIGIVVDSKKIS